MIPREVSFLRCTTALTDYPVTIRNLLYSAVNEKFTFRSGNDNIRLN
jgi:hypothetical protein